MKPVITRACGKGDHNSCRSRNCQCYHHRPETLVTVCQRCKQTVYNDAVKMANKEVWCSRCNLAYIMWRLAKDGVTVPSELQLAFMQGRKSIKDYYGD